MDDRSIGPCSPFFIVTDLARALRHYTQGLGFTCRMTLPQEDPFFAIVGRGSAQILLKVTEAHVVPRPNKTLHGWAPWDAFIHVADPDALATEMAGRGVVFHRPLIEREDGMRGFEVADPDGYVCFFGRPI